jgi:methionyl-tRNA formyltransferase
MILKAGALAAPGRGILNIHFSLLPRWRGAAPVARALMAGDSMSGVTIIKLDEGLDTGPVLTAQAVDVREEESAGELTGRLAVLGARLIRSALPSYLDGDLVPVPQVDEGSTYAAKLTAEDRPLRPSISSLDAINRVRALSPVPAATVTVDGQNLKVIRVRPHPHELRSGAIEVVDGAPIIGVADGSLEIVDIQAPGKRVMPGSDWARGLRTHPSSFR